MEDDTEITQVTTTSTSERSESNGSQDSEHSYNVAERIVWFVAGVLVSLLAIRFILSMLGANTINPFASFVYSASKVFVMPFFSLFKYDGYVYGESRFEIYTIVAILVYLVVALGIVKLLSINRK